MLQRTRDAVLLAAVALCFTGANLLLRSVVAHAPAAVPAEIFSISTPNASIAVVAVGLAVLLAVRRTAGQPQRQRYPQRRPPGWE